MVLIYSDNTDLVSEMLSKGKEFAEGSENDLNVLMVGGDEDQANEYIQRGADRVFMADIGMDRFKVEEFAEVLSNIIDEVEPRVVMIGANKDGKELAPRLAAKYGTGCVTDCTDIYMEDGALTAERVIYSGNAVSVQRFDSEPAFLTIPSKLFDPSPIEEDREGEIIEKDIEISESPSTISDVRKKESEGVNVEDAEIIVSCGRGFDNKEDLELAEDIAGLFTGEAIGCSRPLSADLNWLPEEHWIGLSGHKVKPGLYIAVGISGQIQHIAGMRDSDIVVAVNKDPEAPIFDSADYGIVGDLYDVLPKLKEAIEKEQG